MVMAKDGSFYVLFHTNELALISGGLEVVKKQELKGIDATTISYSSRTH